MGFETKILNVVEEFIPGAEAAFAYGTLFVAGLDNGQATLLLNQVRGSVLCEVEMSPVGPEFAYDFI